MPLLGLAFFLAAAWLGWRTVDRGTILGIGPRLALLLLSLAGIAVFAVLTGLEAFVIGSFCTWCLAAAGAGVLLLVGAVGLWRAPDGSGEMGLSSKARQLHARAAASQRAGARRVMVMTSSATAVGVAGLLAVGALSGQAVTPNGDGNLAPADSPHLGNGAVTVVEWADFQCPACSAVGPMLATLGQNDEATLVYRYFPLTSIHANAESSARAAQAAHLQDEFWPMAERLYATQSAWENLSSSDADAYFLSMATDLGLDADQWRSDYTSAAVRDRVNRDAGEARTLNLPGTPTIYIGGKLYEGERSLAAFRSAIAEAAAEAGAG
jgi:protein-disulfide isomerase